MNFFNRVALLSGIALALGLNGCDGATPGASGDARSASGSTSKDGQAAAESPKTQPVKPAPRKLKLPDAVAKTEARVFGTGSNTAFAKTERGFRAESLGSSATFGPPMRRLADFPADASEPVMFSTAMGSIAVKEVGLTGSAALDGSAVVYANATGSSIWSAVEGGYEEWLLVEKKGNGPVAQWTVEGATPAMQGKEVVLRDANGKPQMTVSAPEGFASADGAAVPLRLAVKGTTIALYADGPDGQMLIDPVWKTAANGIANMNVARSRHTATLLHGGTILVAGGDDNAATPAYTNTAETYDHATDVWTATGTLGTARSGHSATMLKDGRVLIVGGTTTSAVDLATTEIYDPATRTFSAGPALGATRAGHKALLLSDGRVMVIGGKVGATVASTQVDIYTSGVGWAAGTALPAGLVGHFAVMLQDGRILVGGGRVVAGTTTANAYILSADLMTWTAVNMPGALQDSAAMVLQDGKVLVAGGRATAAGAPVTTNYLFTPGAPGAWATNAVMPAIRANHTMTLIPNGLVIAVGGSSSGGGNPPSLSTATYNPQTSTWSAGVSMSVTRRHHTATMLPNGRIMISGGSNAAATATASNDQYNHWGASYPTTGATALPAAMSDPSAVLLPDGRHLVVNATNAYLFEPTGVGTFTTVTAPGIAGPMVLLDDGRPFVYGGNTNPSKVYTVATDTWTEVGTSTAAHAKIMVLPNGSVAAFAMGASPLEVWEPSTGAWRDTSAVNTSGNRGSVHTVLLRDGRLFVYGGDNAGATNKVNSGGIYDPHANSWGTIATTASVRGDGQATLLPDGRVIVAGGHNNGCCAIGYTTAVQAYEPVGNPYSAQTENSWVTLGALPQGSTTPRMVTTRTGQIFYSGGYYPSLTEDNTYFYDYQANTWVATTTMNIGRIRHAVSPQLDERIAIFGGDNYTAPTWSARAEVEFRHEGMTVAAGEAPTITSVAFNATTNQFDVVGTGFTGQGNGTDGTGSNSTPAPQIHFHRWGGFDSRYMPVVDFTATTAKFTMPQHTPGGWYAVSVVVNGIPSSAIAYLMPHPSQAVFTTAAQSVEENDCSGGAAFQLRDANNNPAPADRVITVTLAMASGTVYSDAGCTTPLPTVDIALGTTSSTTFYWKSTADGTRALTATAPGITGSQNQTITAGPEPASLVFTTGEPHTFTAGTCGGAGKVITVELRDATNAVIAAPPGGIAFTIASDSPGTYGFFTDSSCATPAVGGTFTVAAGETDVDIYYRDNRASTTRELSVTNALTLNNPSPQIHTVVSNTPNKMAFITPVRAFTAATCSGSVGGVVTMQAQDTHGNPVKAPPGGYAVQMVSDSGGTHSWYTDASCLTPAVSGNFTIPMAQNSVDVYYIDNLADPSVKFEANTPLSDPDEQYHSVSVGAASQLVFTTSAPQTFKAGVCPGGTKKITVQLRDAGGNAVNAGIGGLAFTASSTTLGTATWFTDASCSSAASGGNFTISSGSHSRDVYYKDTVGGSVDIGISSALNDPTAQTHTVDPADVPVVTVPTVSGIAASKATFEADFTANGVDTLAWFRYSATNPGTCNDTFGAKSPGAGSAVGASFSPATFSHEVTGLQSGITYYYCAIAQNSGGKAMNATPQSFTTLDVAPVQALIAQTGGSGEVKLRWTNAASTSGVLIVRSTSAVAATPTNGVNYSPGDPLGNGVVVSSSGVATSFTDTGLTNGTKYWYKVYNFTLNGTDREYASGDVPSSNGVGVPPTNATGVAPEWCYSVGLASGAQPYAVNNTTVFAVSNARYLTANASSNGNEVWRPSMLDAVVQTRPSVVRMFGRAGSWIVLGDQDGMAYMLDAATGALEWRGNAATAIATRIQAQPSAQTYADSDAAFKAAYPNTDLIYFPTRNGTTNNKVVALRSTDGVKEWEYSPGNMDIASGGLYIDYNRNRLVVTSRSNGGTQPSVRVLDVLNPSTALASFSYGDIDNAAIRDFFGTSALVSTNAGVVHAINMSTLAPAWSKNVGGRVANYVVPINGGFVVSTTAGVQRYQVDPLTNIVTAMWPTPSTATPTVVTNPTGPRVDAARGKVYVADSNGYVHRLNLDTGVDEGQVRLSLGGLGMPSLDLSTTPPRLFVSGIEGKLCALDL